MGRASARNSGAVRFPAWLRPRCTPPGRHEPRREGPHFLEHRLRHRSGPALATANHETCRHQSCQARKQARPAHLAARAHRRLLPAQNPDRGRTHIEQRRAHDIVECAQGVIVPSFAYISVRPGQEGVCGPICQNCFWTIWLYMAHHPAMNEGRPSSVPATNTTNVSV